MKGGRNIIRKITEKGKLNGFEALDALDTLGIIVPNVLHVMNR